MSAAIVGVTPNVIRRLTATLFAAQSIASLGMTAAITVGSIAATQLTGTTAFAGVPTTLFLLGTALGAYPAGRLMERYGRRFGLTLGFLIGTLGTTTAAFALIGVLPLVLFTGNLLMGLSRGALDQGRYAAGDLVSQANRARAIGWVVLGGTVGGIGGPLLIAPASRWAAQLGFDALVGPYLAAAVLFVLGSVMMFVSLRPDPLEIGRHLAREVVDVNSDKLPPRTFSQALESSPIQTAIAAMVLGQVVMVTVMVMTPLQMTEHLHHTLDDVAIVIAAHVTGMYLTSPVTGWIADRVGHAKTILIGAIVLIVACVLAPFSTDTLRLAFALFILGAGWNICFVAGSSLLTDSLRPNERARIQGSNDLLVGLVAATGSLISGFAFAAVGYEVIAFAGITLAIILFGITLWKVQRAPATGSAS
jgi:MFS family permease